MLYRENLKKDTTNILIQFKIGILFFFVLFFYSLTISSVEAKPSYADNPTYCPAGYADFIARKPISGGSSTSKRVCCPSGSEVASNAYYCQTTNSGSSVASIDGRSNAELLGDKEVCKAGQYLVEKVLGEANYCLDIGEKITGGSDDGKFFAGCKTGLSAFKVDENNINGTTSAQTYSLPLFCSGGGGLLVNNKNSCLCGDGTEFPVEDTTPDCSVLCSQRQGVLYDVRSSGSFGNICSGSKCCEGDPKCLECVGSVQGSETGRIYTSLGCIDPTREGIVVWLIRISLILTTVIGVFRFIQASLLIRSGDPEKIKEGQEIVTSAIIALVLVLLSVPLLQFIGVNVLGIFPEGFV